MIKIIADGNHIRGYRFKTEIPETIMSEKFRRKAISHTISASYPQLGRAALMEFFIFVKGITGVELSEQEFIICHTDSYTITAIETADDGEKG